MESEKRKIGVDIDDTLFDFIGAYTLFNNKIYKTCLRKEDFKSYRFNEARGGTMEEAINSVMEFYETNFFKEMQPFPHSVEVINKLKEYNKLYIVTSRPLNMQEGTFNQIFQYFPNIFSDILFSSNHYTHAKNSGKTKGEICKYLDASYLIDDSLVYVKECIENKIKSILFDSPWNQNGSLKEIIRVKNWKEIEGILK